MGLLKRVNDRMKLIASTTGILLAILIVCAILLSFLISSIERAVGNLNKEVLSSFATDIDENLLSLQRYASSFILGDIIRDEDISDMTQNRLADDLKRFQNINPAISAIFVYLPQHDVIFGNLGKFKAENYYILMNGLSSEGSGDFFSALESWSGAGYKNLDDHLVYVIEIRSRKGNHGYMVIAVDTDYLLSSYGSNATIFLISVDGDILTSTLNAEVALEDALCRSSQFGNIKYYSVPLDSPGLTELRTARIVTVIFLIVCLVFGVGGYVYVGWSRTKEFKNLADKLDVIPNYSDINEKLDALLKIGNLSEQKLFEQQSMLSSMFLQYIITNRITDEEQINVLAGRAGLELMSSSFTIAIATDFHLDMAGGFEEDVIIVGMNGDTVFLFGVDDDSDRASHFLKDRCERYGIGGTYDSLSLICQSYDEAYNSLMGIDNVVPSSVESSIETFVGAVKEKRYDDARRIIMELLDADDKLPTEMLSLKYAGTLQFLMKVEGPRKSRLDGYVYSTAKALQKAILIDLDYIDDESSTEVTDKARKLILKEYHDQAFSVYSLAEELGISSSYLSSSFKKKYGIGIARYIAGLRMAEAKELILNTDLTIKEIAMRVGFSSDAAFLRAFKRTESVTPGSLRERMT